MNFFAKNNSLHLPIGTEISVIQRNNKQLAFGFNPNNYNNFTSIKPANISSTKVVKLINGCVAQTFYAIFGENDVDFEICCDNQLCPRGIKLTLVINETRYPFYIPPAKISTFQALETDGRKLHFLSQNSEDGKRMVAATAEKHGTSYAIASVNCSKIIFYVEVEQCLNVEVFSNPFGVSLLGNTVRVHIQTLSGKTTDIMIGTNNTILDLKKLFAKQEGTSINQTLIYNSVSLDDTKQLADYDITTDSKLYVVYNPGFTPPVTAPVFGLPTNSKATLFGSPFNSNATQALFNLPTPPRNNGVPSFGFGSMPPTMSFSSNPTNTSNLFSGEKGVVCYGEQSNQKFTNYDNFKTDFNLIVNSFVIEMRMESKYAPI